MKKWLKISLLLLLCFAFAFFCACAKDAAAPDGGEEPGQTKDPESSETVCTVTFDPDNGAPADTVNVNAGEILKQPADPVREGFIFEGWILPSGSLYKFRTPVTESMTLKASWIELGEAIVPEIETQPATAYASEKVGGSFEVSVKQNRGYVYSYKWYLTNKAETSGGTLLEGQTEAGVAIPAGLKKGGRYYVYGEVTGTKSITGASASAKTGLTRVVVEERPLSALFVGSGILARTVSRQEHDSAAFLQRIARADGEPLIVDSLVLGSNYSIWETGLVGTNYKNVTNMFESRKYDYVVLQLGRDNCLIRDETYNKERLAVTTIYEKVKKYNPCVKVICVVPYTRQDVNSNYYKDIYWKHVPRVETPDALSELIDEFWNRLKDDLPMDYGVVNSNAAFQLAKKNGIQPYVDETNDFAGVQGSYLQACLMYAVIFNKSPVGIRCFETDKFTVDPETGVKLQALAAQVAFGTKTSKLPDVSDYTRFVDIYEDFIEKDLRYKNDPIYKYPEPTVMTKLPAESETAEKKQIRLFLFGSVPMATYNAAQTLVDMIKEGEKAEVVSSFVKLEHTSSTTYNLYEFFKERNDINDLTFSTLRAGPALKSAADKGLDYVILQTGKDYSLSSEEHYNADVISCCKIAKIASEKNPDVKVILVAPYPNTQSFTDVKVGLAGNMREHAALINKQAEDAKAAILKGNYAKNVQVVYVTDAFMNYGDDDAVLKDLYQKADGREGRYNGVNRASAQGAYLMAATIYASVFKNSPVGMPVYGSTGLGYNGKIIDGAMLLKLQKQAYKTAFGKDYKGADTEHTVTFFTNGGTPVAPLKAKTGAKIPAPKDPVRDGLIFAGWFYDPELSGRFSFMQATMPPSDITLYAGWAKPAGSGRSYGEWHTDIKSVLFVGSGPMSGSGYDTGSFFKAIAAKSGRTVKVDTLAKGNNYNIWETGLVGENASEVEKLCKENKYDTLVLMLGRDNALLSESTAQKEIKMIHAIYDAASKHNPDVQVLFFSNYGRQDLEGNMYKQYFIPAKITGRANHAAAIEKYLDKVASVISFPFRIADVNRAFELCISRGVLSPYGSLKTDFADVYGSYLSAACVFAETFKESPVGLDAFTCEKGYEILPSYGMKLQAVAAEAILGIKTDKVREVDDATWIDPDTGKTSTAPPPTLTDGTKVKVHFDDETVEGALNVFMFGGYSLGSFNMYQTLKNLMTASENKPMNLVSATFSHTDTSTTFNLYELFASSARGDINDETFSSLSSGKRAYRYFNSTRFDYLILQTGRDHSIISESTRRYNITTAAKLARIAVDKNPNVKVILVGPYPHMANFGDFASMDKPITDYASHTAAINDELSAAKEAVQKITKNVVTVSLADLFLAYSSDTAKIKTDLYREANDVKTMANVGNRASAKGSYLAAAAVCAAALNKSPTGLGYFGYETSSIKGKLEKDDAIAMQKLASKFVLGKEGKVPDTFKVNIDPLNGSPITSTDAKEGDAVERPEDPVKEGYIFKGWYEGYDYSKEFNFEKGTVPFGGLTLVARWKLIVDRSTPPAIKEPNITTGDVGRSPTILIVGAGVFTRTDSTLPHDFTGFFEELLKKDGYNPEIRTRVRGTNYNLWETGLVGENNSLVEEKLKDGKVDVMILQSTRDNPVVWDSSAQREINAVNSLCELARSYNPKTKIVYVISHARQDLKAAYGAETYAAFSGADITEREDHAYAINDRMNSYLLPAMKHGMSVVDVNSVFEYLLKNDGINPWNGTSDFAGKYGDYAMACAVYAGVTGKSPVGILKFTAKKTSVEPTRGVAIQKAAARIVLGQTEVPEVDITDAYVDRAGTGVLFIGGRTLNDNKLPETLGQFLDQARRDNVVMTLTGSETLAEFVDSTSVNVEFSYGGETYDYMVLELGRDDVLYDQKAAEKEMAAIDRLVALGKANNKQIKIVLVAPAARQNKAGQLYQDQVENNGVTSASDHAKLISAYAKKLAGENCIVCDIAAASELALEKGINPYTNYVSDNLSADGSYLTACMLYNAMFGDMAADITYTGGANAENAKILKEIAASMFAD